MLNARVAKLLAANDDDMMLLQFSDVNDEQAVLTEMNSQAGAWLVGRNTPAMLQCVKEARSGPCPGYGVTTMQAPATVPMMPAHVAPGLTPLHGAVDFVSQWIIDSGASYGLIDKDDVVDSEERCHAAGTPRVVTSANGIITLDTEVVTIVPTLQESITCFVRAGTANVLSLGELCVDMGCSFIWQPHVAPRFWDPSGNEVPMVLHNNVPMMNNVPAHVAAAAKTDASDTESDAGYPYGRDIGMADEEPAAGGTGASSSKDGRVIDMAAPEDKHKVPELEGCLESSDEEDKPEPRCHCARKPFRFST